MLLLKLLTLSINFLSASLCTQAQTLLLCNRRAKIKDIIITVNVSVHIYTLSLLKSGE